jgi:hypothetical protein
LLPLHSYLGVRIIESPNKQGHTGNTSLASKPGANLDAFTDTPRLATTRPSSIYNGPYDRNRLY